MSNYNPEFIDSFMRIVLFCENKYSIDILYPLYVEAAKEKKYQILWYIHYLKIPQFPFRDEVEWTNSIQEIYDFSPEAIFVPGNIVPYYLPGVKIQVFHGYAAEKKIIGSFGIILIPTSHKALFLQRSLQDSLSSTITLRW